VGYNQDRGARLKYRTNGLRQFRREETISGGSVRTGKTFHRASHAAPAAIATRRDSFFVTRGSPSADSNWLIQSHTTGSSL